MRIQKTKVYPYSELADEVKDLVLENLRDINVDYEWWVSSYDDIKEIGKLMGIDIDRIYFSGFSSQGDGACFEGSYEFKVGSVKAVMEYAPKDYKLHLIVKELQAVQRRYFYQVSAMVKQSGHYMHEMCTSIDVGHNDFYSYRLPEGAEDGIKEGLRDFMRWIYRRLESEYEYLTSEEVVKDSIEANESEFTVDGKSI